MGGEGSERQGTKKKSKQPRALSPQNIAAPPCAETLQCEANISKSPATARQTEPANTCAVDIQKQRATRTKQQRATVNFLGSQQLMQLKQLFKHACASSQQSQEHEDMKEEVRRHIRQLEACIEVARDMDVDDENFDNKFSVHCKAFMELNSTAINACMKLRSLNQAST